MDDMTPSLLKAIQDDFQRNLNKSEVISGLYAKVRDGTATYAQANQFAIEVGELLAGAYKNNLSSDVLPDGKMYYNIAQQILNTTMKNNYDLITEVTEQVQQSLNEAADIGIKPITPQLNQDRIDGIIGRVSDADYFDDVAWILGEPIVNFSQSIVDDSIRENAEFQSAAGLQPLIIRKVAGNCCKWCKALAGKYRYPDEVPNDVYRRHQRCRCTVDYNPRDGKVQNVYSKQWKRESIRDKIEARKNIGIDQSMNRFRTANFRTANMSNEEFARGKKLWNQYDELPLSRKEKEWVYAELDANLTVEERECCVVRKAIGDYWYRAINLGHNQYKIIGKEPIEPYEDIVDEVLSEMFGRDWRNYL